MFRKGLSIISLNNLIDSAPSSCCAKMKWFSTNNQTCRQTDKFAQSLWGWEVRGEGLQLNLAGKKEILKSSSLLVRGPDCEGCGLSWCTCVCECVRVVAPQGHITALIQFHVNLRVNATLIRQGSWLLRKAADALTPVSWPRCLTCGTARLDNRHSTQSVGRQGPRCAFKIIYNICENMFAKCQQLRSCRRFAISFCRAPKSMLRFFIPWFLFFLVITCGLLRTWPMCVRGCGWADWNVCYANPANSPTTSTTRMCWQHLCNGKFVRIVRAEESATESGAWTGVAKCFGFGFANWNWGLFKLLSCLTKYQQICQNNLQGNGKVVRVNTDMTGTWQQQLPEKLIKTQPRKAAAGELSSPVAVLK